MGIERGFIGCGWLLPSDEEFWGGGGVDEEEGDEVGDK